MTNQPPEPDKKHSDFQLEDVDVTTLDDTLQTTRSFQSPQAGSQQFDEPLPELRTDFVENPIQTKVQQSNPSAQKIQVGNDSGLLSSLRQKAEQVRTVHLQREIETRKDLSSLDSALRFIFQYTCELITLLNEIKPPCKHTYFINEELSVSDLHWSDGFCDYQTEPGTGGQSYTGVSFNYTLKNPDAIEFERPKPIANAFCKLLTEYGLSYTQKDNNQHPEKHTTGLTNFQIDAQIKVIGLWYLEPETEKIMLNIKNLSRFGSREFLLSASQINNELLDEMAKLILGESNRFNALLRAK